MDIILLVVVIFSGEGFHSLEVRDYYNSAMRSEGDCEAYIGSARFRKSLKLTGITQPRVRAACLGTMQLPGFHDLIKGAKSWKTVALNQKEDAVVLTGKIRFDENVGMRKSVDAYLGKRLVIATADGIHVIYGSDQVKEADLIKLNGKKVKLRVFFEDTTPHENSPEEYPLGPDNRPMKRTGYRVIAIE